MEWIQNIGLYIMAYAGLLTTVGIMTIGLAKFILWVVKTLLIIDIKISNITEKRPKIKWSNNGSKKTIHLYNGDYTEAQLKDIIILMQNEN